MSQSKTTSEITQALPLKGLRILDMADGSGEMCGRILADMGAEVILLEPPQGLSSRQLPPTHQGQSLRFETHNANKLSVVLDLDCDQGKRQFLSLLDSADVLITQDADGELDSKGLSIKQLREARPSLIILSLTDFGLTGPYKDYKASNAVQLAMAGVLARSGIEGNRPLLPPGELAFETTAIQAAWVVLLAHWQRLHTGLGDFLDFSTFEATAQILDPGLGVTGSAAAGRSANEMAPFGRPPVGKLYPIFPCADGYVRVCVLNPRQWQGMCAWLGDDHPFTDPKFAKITNRHPVIAEINAVMANLFKNALGADLVKEGQSRGVPIAVVATPEQVLADEQFNARGAFAYLTLDSGEQGKMPSGYLEINSKRMGVRANAPKLGQHTEQVLSNLVPKPASEGSGQQGRRPFEGLRVLDLGVIVAGAELGRLFADQGAQVIKVENSSFPDGLRQSPLGVAISQSFSQGSRNKQSFGLNLRTEKGIAIFNDLVKEADVVLSNFKPGTLESLGIGFKQLQQINKGICVLESSALGNTGPMAKSLGYGPLVRASSGLTGLWCYPEIPNSFSDSTTIFPDHFAARVAAVGVASALIQREHTGCGSQIVLSQAEAILNTMSTQLLRESLEPGSSKALGNQYEFDAPSNVFACAGDDLWCVIETRSDEQFKKLANAIGQTQWLDKSDYATAAGRVAKRNELEEIVAQWTESRSPYDVLETLQAAGVIAGNMQRLSEFDNNPHFLERKFFRHFEQPGFPTILQTENGPVSFSGLPEPEIKPAPFQGQHTKVLSKQLLGYSEQQIEALVNEGVLEPMKPNEFVQA